MSRWQRTRIDVADSSGFDLWRLDSGVPGPRVVVLGGVHGDETEGVLAAGRLTSMPLDLGRGVLDVVPVCHEAAFAVDSRTSPRDGGNLARVFPGDPGGEPTERLAWHLTEHVLAGADLLIDLHTSGQSYDMPFLAGFRNDERDPDRLGERAAAAVGADFLWHHPERSEGRTLSVVDVGIYLECPGGGPADLTYVERYTTGVTRALGEAGILNEPVSASPRASPIRVTGGGNLDQDMASVAHDGVFVHTVGRGDAVEAGQPLGTVVNVRGEHLEELAAATSGYVMAVKRRSRVRAGEMVALVARETEA